MSVETLPRTRSRDHLKGWAAAQKRVNLTVVQSAALDEVHPDWRRTADDKWRTNLAAVEAFVAAHGRLPNQRERDGSGRAVGSWLNTQRAGRAMTDYRRIELNRALPGWDTSLEAKWLAALDYVAAFHARNARMPSSTTDDEVERFHGRWIVAQRRAENLSPARQQALDSRLPAWRRTLEDKWLERLEAVEAFFARHGKAPSSTSADPEEATLGIWWRHVKKGKGTDPGRVAVLDARLPHWRQNQDGVWAARLEEVLAFYRDHCRFPDGAASDPQERVLGNWLRNARNPAESRAAERLATLDTRLPFWRLTKREVWTRQLDAVAAFVAAQGRFPSAASDDADESFHRRWLDLQQGSRAKSAVLDRQMPGWRAQAAIAA